MIKAVDVPGLLAVARGTVSIAKFIPEIFAVMITVAGQTLFAGEVRPVVFLVTPSGFVAGFAGKGLMFSFQAITRLFFMIEGCSGSPVLGAVAGIAIAGGEPAARLVNVILAVALAAARRGSKIAGIGFSGELTRTGGLVAFAAGEVSVCAVQ